MPRSLIGSLIQTCARVTAIIVMTAGLTGCYHHVVDASGPSQGHYTVYEPNVKTDDEAAGNEKSIKKVPSKVYQGSKP